MMRDTDVIILFCFKYFFTVRELREAILQFSTTVDVKVDEEEIRVGGRVVEKSEGIRSKRCKCRHSS